MYQRFWHFVRNNHLLVLFTLLFQPHTGFTHGQADLCDRREDLIEQCGEFHDCLVDEHISPHIGFCKAEFEEIHFIMCDRGSDMVQCPMGEICKIGIIDPSIGVCSPLSHEHQGTMNELINGESEGCQSRSTDLFPFSILFSLYLISLYLHRRCLSSPKSDVSSLTSVT